ncbi:hypothetical protein IPT12_11605 [Xanthomonas perforans]|uniref:hypothetical protein n=1 Tax=Xanthomonas perforans TaxID=442694 RepID=UPI00062D8CD9|nr:hypothetical protein [Xanthomonas perforans]KLC45455.1 hypothetical protein XP1712_14015 [Xanthomonas perforans]MBZ2413080.1 hypothetical protein [Xanthomonas perforans]MBZ2421051.1 hypothetical protein [Xanthomonas perforans]MBZ2425704.1 hypothetical protein [Xanthomonas perforans]MBZ2430364.1 hypothetical protein [Xanthomonas perforans]
MRLIASLVYCLLALAGCHERNGTTSITRATRDGASTPTCARKTLDSFVLVPGQVRELRGVPGQAHTCVETTAPQADCRG